MKNSDHIFRALRYCCLLLIIFFITNMTYGHTKHVFDTMKASGDGPCGISISYKYSNSNTVSFTDSYVLQTLVAVPESRTFYKWYFGDGTEAVGKNVSHQFLAPGSYTVTLYKAYYDTLIQQDKVCDTRYYDISKGEYNPCHYTLLCENKASVTIVIEQPFTALCQAIIDFKNSDQTFYFQDLNASQGYDVITYWLWDLGDQSFLKEKSGEHTYSNPGTYEVKLTKVVYETIRQDMVCQAFFYDSTIQQTIPCFYKKLCSETAVVKINVGSNNDPHCTSKIAYNQNQNVLSVNDYFELNTLLAENIKTYWRWDFGDGTYSNKRDASHKYKAPGKYEVKLTKGAYRYDTSRAIRCDGFIYDTIFNVNIYCSDVSLCRDVYSFGILVEPIVDHPQICNAEVITGTSGNTIIAKDTFDFNRSFYPTNEDMSKEKYLVSWHWDFGDGTTGKGKDVKHDYSQPGNYTLTLKKTAYAYDPYIKIQCNQDSTYDVESGIYIPCKYVKSCEQFFKYPVHVTESSSNCKNNMTYTVENGYSVLFSDTIEEYLDPNPYLHTFYYFNYGDGTSGESMGHQYPANGVYHGSFVKAVYRSVLLLVPCSTSYYDQSIQRTIECNMIPVCKEAYPFTVDLSETTACFDHFNSSESENTIHFSVNNWGGPFELFMNDPTDTIHYHWDFGDSTDYGYGTSVTHTYSKEGKYKVTVMAASKRAKTAPCTKWIDINSNKIVASIYPQPFKENALFNLQNYEGIYDLELFDLNGRLIKSIQKNTDSTLRLDGSDMDAGLYFYQVVANGKVIFRGKMVIQ